MKVAIVGSRDYPNLDEVENFVLSLPKGTTVISGAAIGVDRTAARVARGAGLEVVEFLPEWEKYGRSAGFRRNRLIVEACDELVAFHHNRSKGTQSSIDLARGRGIPVRVFASAPQNLPANVPGPRQQ